MRIPLRIDWLWLVLHAEILEIFLIDGILLSELNE